MTGTEPSFFCRPAGGIERAGTWIAGRAWATCFVGSGEGIGTVRFGRGLNTGTWAVEALVARAGVLARARLTIDLAGLFTGFRDWALAAFFLGLFATRGLFLFTIQTDISKAFAESINFFQPSPETGRGWQATPVSH